MQIMKIKNETMMENYNEFFISTRNQIIKLIEQT